jgi:hypothetical protein
LDLVKDHENMDNYADRVLDKFDSVTYPKHKDMIDDLLTGLGLDASDMRIEQIAELSQTSLVSAIRFKQEAEIELQKKKEVREAEKQMKKKRVDMRNAWLNKFNS